MVDKAKVKKSVDKVKSTTGKVVGDRRLQAGGKIDEVKGRAKQAGQKVKETLKK